MGPTAWACGVNNQGGKARVRVPVSRRNKPDESATMEPTGRDTRRADSERKARNIGTK